MKLLTHIVAILGVMAISATGMAQSQEQAKKLFNQGNYAEAKPMMQKLLKRNPRNGSLNYWYGVCLYETGEADKCRSYLEVAAERRVREANRYLALLSASEYRYAEAVESWDTYLAQMQKEKKPVDEYQQAYKQATLGKQMMRAVKEVTVIDSFVVDKATFIEAYRISPEAGTLQSYNSFFGNQTQPEGVVYMTEMKNRIYYSASTPGDSILSLYASDLIGSEWDEGALLQGIPTQGAEATNYPYMMSDGCTFYYAACGESSLGGYDLFVTRYDAEENRYLYPENMGMPFNSPANDYMLVIDEYSNLGWFASDRYQPEGKVCVYVFLPDEGMNRILPDEEIGVDTLAQRAKLASIKQTWSDEQTVRKGKQQLATLIYSMPKTSGKVGDFEFVIDDLNTYHTRADFRSPKAREAFDRLQQSEKSLSALQKKLEEKRMTYAKASAQKRAAMTAEILDLEQRVETLETSIMDMEIEVRNLEIGE